MPRRILLLWLSLFVCLSLVLPVQAQSSPTLSGPSGTVIPLQPVPVEIRFAGNSGPATLLVFDARARFVGGYDVNLQNGSARVNVIPRGALGPAYAALFVGGRKVAETGQLYLLDASTQIWTGQPRFDGLWQRLRTFMSQSTLSYNLDGTTVYGYRSPDSPLLWLRDHVYQLRAARLFDPNMRSAMDAFTRAQFADGSLPDFLARPEWGIPTYRTPVEADVEYLYVQGIYEIWQSSGDNDWLRAQLPAARRALLYNMSHPLRWEASLGLVKRPLTIDTWDFEIGPATIDPNSGKPAPRHWIDERTTWSIFHGDNTGLAAALRLMAQMEARVGDPALAAHYRSASQSIMSQLNRLAWNGSFYAHHVPLTTPPPLGNVDLRTQLSLSNALALTRDVLTLEQARSILAEYRSRLSRSNNLAFAEWYSIDPPFPEGVIGMGGAPGERPGEYVNGGIMPLVGGALARGAFEYGEESYGFDILQRYDAFTTRSGQSFLWYAPTGGPGLGTWTLATDGWGSAMMLDALFGGAAGISDTDARMRELRISPRWTAQPDVNGVYLINRYAASDAYVAYWWRRLADRLELEVSSTAERMQLRLLLPAGVTPSRVLLNGQPVASSIEVIGPSRYLTLTAEGPLADLVVIW